MDLFVGQRGGPQFYRHRYIKGFYTTNGEMFAENRGGEMSMVSSSRGTPTASHRASINEHWYERKVKGVSRSVAETEWPMSVAKYEVPRGNLPLGDPTRFDRLV